MTATLIADKSFARPMHADVARNLAELDRTGWAAKPVSITVGDRAVRNRPRLRAGLHGVGPVMVATMPENAVSAARMKRDHYAAS